MFFEKTNDFVFWLLTPFTGNLLRSQSLYRKYGPNLPTSLTRRVAVRPKAANLGDLMRFLVRFRRQYRVFNLNGFSMIIIKYRVKLSFTLLANMTPSLVKLIPESQHAYLDAERWACNTIKERRNLLWAFINISPLKWASQLYDPLRGAGGLPHPQDPHLIGSSALEGHTYALNLSSRCRNINLIPFRTFYGVTLVRRTD
jgi:hypothetical protein